MTRNSKQWTRLWPLAGIRRWRDNQIERFYRRQGFLPIAETHEQDIFLCGYPKSGNTWVQNLLASLVFGLEPRYLTDRLVQEIVPDVHQAEFYKRFFEPCFFKTHRTSRQEYRRVVHLVRDPRDVAGSFFHFDKARGKNVDLDAKVCAVINNWRRHTEGYIENRNDAAVMTLRYEDLLEKPEIEVQRLAEFIGLERSEDIKKRVIEGNRFSEIKKREKQFGLANPRWPSDANFFRKGQAGSFSDTLSTRHVSLIERELAELMNYYDYKPCHQATA